MFFVCEFVGSAIGLGAFYRLEEWKSGVTFDVVCYERSSMIMLFFPL